MRDLNVDQIKKLWVLDLIIRTGSLKRAAQEAKVSASAVAQSLSSLEKSVGKSLLVRDKGVVTPTRDALAILEIVRPAFEAFDRLREVNHGPIPKMSWLDLGAYESLAVDVLPGLIGSLRERMPGLKLGLKIGRTGNLLTMVRKGELCSALVTEVDDLDRFYVKEVASDRLGYWVSSRMPISQLGWKAAETFGIGSLSPGRDGLPRYFKRFMRASEPLKPSVTSESFEALRAAAAAGAIVAVLPERVATRANDLMEISPPGPRKPGETGHHRILLVGKSNCDPEEADYLADEARRQFALRTPLHS